MRLTSSQALDLVSIRRDLTVTGLTNLSDSRMTEAKPRRTDRPGLTKRQDGAEALLNAGEKLFAVHGIDAVSMREISRQAGHRNNSALAYHFGSKEELVYQIIRRRMTATDKKRGALLDEIEAANRQNDVRALAEALVRPLAEHLLTGRKTRYLRVLAAAQAHPSLDLVAATRDLGRYGFRRVFAHLRERLPGVPEIILRQRFISMVSYIIFSLADFERIKARRNSGARTFNTERAIENLIDMVAGALSAAPSSEVLDRLKD
jgi:AcrR family transcriptional regulator